MTLHFSSLLSRTFQEIPAPEARCGGSPVAIERKRGLSINENEKRDLSCWSRHQATVNKEGRNGGLETRTSFLLLRKEIPAPPAGDAGPWAIDTGTRTSNEERENEDQ